MQVIWSCRTVSFLESVMPWIYANEENTISKSDFPFSSCSAIGCWLYTHQIIIFLILVIEMEKLVGKSCMTHSSGDSGHEQ